MRYQFGLENPLFIMAGKPCFNVACTQRWRDPDGFAWVWEVHKGVHFLQRAKHSLHIRVAQTIAFADGLGFCNDIGAFASAQVVELEKASKRIQGFFWNYMEQCHSRLMGPVQIARGMVAAAPAGKPYHLVLLAIGAMLGATHRSSSQRQARSDDGL